MTATDPFQNLHNKLTLTAKKLNSWSSSVFSDIKLRTLIINEIIYQLDVARDSRTLSWEEHTFRGKLKMMLLGLAALDRCIWRQKSRYLGLREGDCNTKFYSHESNIQKEEEHYPQSVH